MSNQRSDIPDPTLGDPNQFQTGVIDPAAPPAVQQQAAQPPITIVQPSSANAPTNPQTFTAADIEAARQQEKDKLYSRLSEQDQTLAELKADKEARDAAAAEAQRLAEEAARQAQEAEMSAKELIDQRDREWKERFAQIEQEREQERAIAAKEQEMIALQGYIAQVKMQVQEDVLPELMGNIGVNCNSQAEVDASASTAIEQSASILQNVTQAGAGAPAFQPPRGASITAPPIGPADAQAATKTFTPEEIAAMSPNEYAQHRTALLQGVSQHVKMHGYSG